MLDETTPQLEQISLKTSIPCNCRMKSIHCSEIYDEPRRLTKFQQRRRVESPSSFKKSRLVALVTMFCVQISLLDVCMSFHTGLPANQRRRRTRSRFGSKRLFVVEPTQCTESTPSSTLPESSWDGSHANVLGSIVFEGATADESHEEIDCSAEEQEEDEFEQDDGEESKEERLVNAAKAAALLARRRGQGTGSRGSSKNTSVGARRVGSASQARSGSSSMSRLGDAVRKAAAANTAPKKLQKPNQEEGPTLSISKSVIQATVENMMNSSMGIFGLPEQQPQPASQEANFFQVPTPGTVLVPSEQSNRMWKAVDRISVRTATTADDLDIASLRLSVFSDFSPDMRRAFVSKSCQVLATRRSRGATCVVATIPRYGSIMSPRPDIILGTAECSFHEFEGTMLGRRRLPHSILYITEVAVNPTARRKGIGQKMMESMDELAKTREIETLFLHVDTTNFGALSLYQQAGFSVMPSDDPMFEEFTRSLNLHDGATKGRNHFLLMKDISQPTWLPEPQIECQRGTLGFEITS